MALKVVLFLFFLLRPSPGKKQAIWSSWTCTSSMASHDALWPTSEFGTNAETNHIAQRNTTVSFFRKHLEAVPLLLVSMMQLISLTCSHLPQMIPPPPPPMSPDMVDDEALGSVLISWYMSGYHTGFYLVR